MSMGHWCCLKWQGQTEVLGEEPVPSATLSITMTGISSKNSSLFGLCSSDS